MEDNEDDIGRKLIEKGNLGAKVGAKRGVRNNRRRSLPSRRHHCRQPEGQVTNPGSHNADDPSLKAGRSLRETFAQCDEYETHRKAFQPYDEYHASLVYSS